jgi:dTDP-4-amino-4,6-dideoxygalactose transaminase
VIYVGTNGKMPEIAAAMGVTSLESLDEFIGVNRENYRRYAKALQDIPGVRLRRYDDTRRQNYQYVIVEIDPAAAITRDALVDLLHAENVIARRYFYPGCHGMEPYRTLQPNAGATLPNTVKLADAVLALPTGTGVTHDDIETICAIVRFAAGHGREIEKTREAKLGSAKDR